jgi:hypothetical protein
MCCCPKLARAFAPLRNRGRPSCDKLAHPTPPRRIAHDDRNISFLRGLERGAPACVRGAPGLRGMQERLPAAAFNQGSVYQMRNGNEDEIHFARRTAALAQGNAAPGITMKK